MNLEHETHRMVADWLEQSYSDGSVHSHGRFTMDPLAAELQGVERLGPADVPLLLLAGALEAGSGDFGVEVRGDVRFRWQKSGGESAALAYSLLRRAGVDFRAWEGGVDLPPIFAEFLAPLAARCRHAPIHFTWNGQLISSPRPAGQMILTASSRPRLVLVDRGVDFVLNASFAGLDIVAWIDPLPGDPWPRRLLSGAALKKQLTRIAVALSRSLKAR